MTMNSDDSYNPLTPEVTEALRELREYPNPPEELEDETVRRLKARGLIKDNSLALSVRSLVRYAAAALVILSAGFGLGRWSSAPVEQAPNQSLFMMALYEPADQKIEGDHLAAEYGKWLHEVGADGRVTGGEALKYEVRSLVADKRREFYERELQEEKRTVMSGYFLIEAANLEEAKTIARQSPHIKYGGAIVIREVLPTSH